MIKMVAAVRRKPGMTHAECLEYIEHTHGRIAREKPLGLELYRQNHVYDSAFGDDADATYVQTFHRDSVTELYFADFSGLIQTFSDPYTQQKIGPDGENFADLATQAAQLMSETEIAVSNPGFGKFKVLHFIKKFAETDLQQFFQRWHDAHETAEKDCPEFSRVVRRHVRSKYLPEGDKITAYFGPAIQVSEGLSSMWFDTEQDLSTFRSYQRAFAQSFEQAGGGLDASNSYFLYAKEVVIFDRG